jgi:dienelactone hydrolase
MKWMSEAAAADETDQQEDDCDDQQDVQETAERILRDNPQKPENDENDDDTDHDCLRRASYVEREYDSRMPHDQLSRRDVLQLTSAASLAPFASMTRQPSPSTAGSPAARRRELYGLLGVLPDRKRPIGGKKRGEETRDGYVLETWDLDLNGIETVPAYFARPTSLSGRVPGVLFNHSHGGGYKIGKQEFIEGRSYLDKKPYAQELTEMGYVALCIDSWIFGERSHTSETDMFKAMLWQGQVLWGMMVYDGLRALDYLLTRPEVDPQRVATLGMSMGSTMAWWLGALDERIKVTVDINCLTDFQALLARKALSLHGVYYFVPSLIKHFTTAQINALIAPRAHLGLAGLRDKLTPVEGLDVIDKALQQVYAKLGHPERWKLLRYDVEHQETPEGRQEIIAFLKRFL